LKVYTGEHKVSEGELAILKTKNFLFKTKNAKIIGFHQMHQTTISIWLERRWFWKSS